MGELRKLVVGAGVPRQEFGRFSVDRNVGMVGLARPTCTSVGRFQAMASCGLISLGSMTASSINVDVEPFVLQGAEPAFA